MLSDDDRDVDVESDVSTEFGRWSLASQTQNKPQYTNKNLVVEFCDCNNLTILQNKPLF